MNAAGAGAGPGPAQRKRLITENEKKELLTLVKSGKQRNLIDRYSSFLKKYPDIDTNTLFEGGSTLLYHLARMSVDPSHPLFNEVLRREPDPTLRSPSSGLTPLEESKRNCEDLKQLNRASQYEKCKRTQAALERYELFYKTRAARNLSSLMRVSKEGLKKAPYVNELVGEYLTGKKGPLPVQMSQLRVYAGLPGVPIGEQRGGKRARTTRRKKTSKRKSRKSIKI